MIVQYSKFIQKNADPDSLEFALTRVLPALDDKVKHLCWNEFQGGYRDRSRFDALLQCLSLTPCV